MEQIVHYRNVKETFIKTIKVENKVDETKPVERPWWEEDVAAANALDDLDEEEGIRIQCKEQTKTYTSIDTPLNSIEELKEAMSQNHEVKISREVIVVTEDLTKGTLSFRKYYFSKVFVNVKKSKRRYFKILNKHMMGVTINRKTGDYAIYNQSKSGRNNFVRLNITTDKCKHILKSLASGSSPTETYDAMCKFYELLEFKPIMTYELFVKYYFRTALPVDSVEKYSLTLLPFLNYLLKHGIQVPPYHQFIYFQTIFRKDKKEFYDNGSGLVNYLMKYHDLKHFDYALDIVGQLNHYALQHYPNEVNRIEKVKAENKGAQVFFNHLTVNKFAVFIMNRYGYTRHDLSQMNIINLDQFTAMNNYEIQPYMIEMLDMYRFPVVDLVRESNLTADSSLTVTLQSLYYFYTFGIKLKIKTLEEFRENEDMYMKLYDALCIARSKTGTVMVNAEFVNKLKKFLGEGEKFGIHQQLKVPTTKRYRDPFSNDPDKKYQAKHDWDSTLPAAYLMGNDLKLSFKLSFARNGIHIVNNQLDLYNNLNFLKLTETLRYNRKKILDSLKIKQLYSKAYFEQICLNEFKINSAELVEYLP